MRPLTQAATTAARSWTRHALPNTAVTSRLATPTLTTSGSPSRPRRASNTAGHAQGPTSFDSPFGQEKGVAPPSTKIPSFKAYMARSGESTNRVFQYFMVGSMGLLTAAGAKATVQGMGHHQEAPTQRRQHRYSVRTQD